MLVTDNVSFRVESEKERADQLGQPGCDSGYISLYSSLRKDPAYPDSFKSMCSDLLSLFTESVSNKPLASSPSYGYIPNNDERSSVLSQISALTYNDHRRDHIPHPEHTRPVLGQCFLPT